MHSNSSSSSVSWRPASWGGGHGYSGNSLSLPLGSVVGSSQQVRCCHGGPFFYVLCPAFPLIYALSSTHHCSLHDGLWDCYVLWHGQNHISLRRFTVPKSGSWGPTRSSTVLRTYSLVLCSFQEIPRNLLRLLFSNTWIFFSVTAMSVQDSHPYSRMDTTSDLKSLYFVWKVILFLQTLSSRVIAAVAWAILMHTSAVLPHTWIFFSVTAKSVQDSHPYSRMDTTSDLKSFYFVWKVILFL